MLISYIRAETKAGNLPSKFLSKGGFFVTMQRKSSTRCTCTCTVHVQHMYCTCAVHVQYMYSTYTYTFSVPVSIWISTCQKDRRTTLHIATPPDCKCACTINVTMATELQQCNLAQSVTDECTCNY